MEAERLAPSSCRAVANQGPIAIDDSDEEDGEVNFPDLKPTLASAPRSVVTRGKQREAGPSAKAGPPREPPPANPHELCVRPVCRSFRLTLTTRHTFAQNVQLARDRPA